MGGQNPEIQKGPVKYGKKPKNNAAHKPGNL
jgi:hypothetical protein